MCLLAMRLVGADALIGPYKVRQKIAKAGGQSRPPYKAFQMEF